MSVKNGRTDAEFSVSDKTLMVQPATNQQQARNCRTVEARGTRSHWRAVTILSAAVWDGGPFVSH